MSQLKQYVPEFDKHFDKQWHQQAIDYAGIEGTDFIDVKPTLGSKFSTFKLKLEKYHENFRKQFREAMGKI